MNKLSVKGLAFAAGALWAFYILFAGWASALGWGTNFVSAFSNLYIGYGPSFIGGLIGALWGFLDGAIAGFIIASIYNWTIKIEKKTK